MASLVRYQQSGKPWSQLLRRSNKIVCIGRNYADHIQELDSVRPKQPFFFLKPPTSLLLPDAGPVRRPRGVDLHHEVELALVLGRGLKDWGDDREHAAMDAVAWYAVSIDMTARNVQAEAKNKGLPWCIAKGFDTFLPMGPRISKADIPDPHDVELFLEVNGEMRQDDSTKLMLFRIPRILNDISKVMTLQPGDIVLTGTPKGVGPVVPGDTMRCGLRVNGKELEAAQIKVAVEESLSSYEYADT